MRQELCELTQSGTILVGLSLVRKHRTARQRVQIVATLSKRTKLKRLIVGVISAFCVRIVGGLLRVDVAKLVHRQPLDVAPGSKTTTTASLTKLVVGKSSSQLASGAICGLPNSGSSTLSHGGKILGSPAHCDVVQRGNVLIRKALQLRSIGSQSICVVGNRTRSRSTQGVKTGEQGIQARVNLRRFHVRDRLERVRRGRFSRGKPLPTK